MCRTGNTSIRALKKFVVVKVFIADECIATCVVTKNLKRAVKCYHTRSRIEEFFL